MSSRLDSLRKALAQPVDGASLAVFRILFGLLMAWEAFRYLRFGYVKEYYLDTSFHFTFLGFDWVRVFHPALIYGIYGTLGLCGLAIAWGVLYRAAIAIFTVGFSYVFLLDTAYYLNHYYVILLLAGVLTVSPASHLFGWEKQAPGQRRESVPAWTLWLLRGQLQVIYIFAAVAKLNSDWLAGEPVRMWLSPLAHSPTFGAIFQHDVVFLLISYSGILVDGVAAPLLLFRKTRLPAMVVLGVFHVSNELLFGIGVFPPLMLAANLLFLSPSWPRALPGAIREQLGFSSKGPTEARAERKVPLPLMIALGSFTLLQLLLPLRHHLYPGDVAWTEEGHRFSWRMKLRDKEGEVRFFTTDQDGNRIPLTETTPLNGRQRSKMACHPDMLLQFAHHLAREHTLESGKPRPVFAETKCRVNAGPWGKIVDPDFDLLQAKRSLAPYPFVLPRPRG